MEIEELAIQKQSPLQFLFMLKESDSEHSGSRALLESKPHIFEINKWPCSQHTIRPEPGSGGTILHGDQETRRQDCHAKAQRLPAEDIL